MSRLPFASVLSSIPMRYIHLKGCVPSGAAGLPCGLGGTEEQQDRADPTIPARSGAARDTRAAPALDTGLAPPRDGMLATKKGDVSRGLGATASQGLHQKQLPRARFRAGCSLSQPFWSLCPCYMGTGGAPGFTSIPHSHSQSPRSGLLPGPLHSFAQA